MAEVKQEIMYNGNKYVLEDEDHYVFEKPIDSKRTYRYEKDHSHDMSYENEKHNDPVNSPNHYKQGSRETIEVIRDYMTNDEFCGYLKGNIIKYVGRFKFKGQPLQDLQKGQWYLNKLIQEVSKWDK